MPGEPPALEILEILLSPWAAWLKFEVSQPNLKWLLDLMASRYPFQSFPVIQRVVVYFVCPYRPINPDSGLKFNSETCVEVGKKWISLLIFHIISSFYRRRRLGIQTVLSLKEPMDRTISIKGMLKLVYQLKVQLFSFWSCAFLQMRLLNSVVLWLVCWRPGNLQFWIMLLRLSA